MKHVKKLSGLFLLAIMIAFLPGNFSIAKAGDGLVCLNDFYAPKAGQTNETTNLYIELCNLPITSNDLLHSTVTWTYNGKSFSNFEEGKTYQATIVCEFDNSSDLITADDSLYIFSRFNFEEYQFNATKSGISITGTYKVRPSVSKISIKKFEKPILGNTFEETNANLLSSTVTASPSQSILGLLYAEVLPYDGTIKFSNLKTIYESVFVETTEDNVINAGDKTLDYVVIGLDDNYQIDKSTQIYLNGTALNSDSIWCNPEASGTYVIMDKSDFTSVNLSGMNYALSYKTTTYTGATKKPVVVIPGLVKDTDYQVSYGTNKSVGKGTVTITGIGACHGTIKTTFTIKPITPKISKATVGTRKLTVTMLHPVKELGASYYQVQYRVKGTSSWKSATATTSQTKTLSSLTKGKYYQVRVRAYKKVNGTTYYSAWSSTKTSGIIK